MRESATFVTTMIFQSISFVSFMVAIVLICRQPKVKKAVLALWVNGILFISLGFPLIVILTYPKRFQKTYLAPVIIWMYDLAQGAEHLAYAYIYITSAFEFDRMILKEAKTRAKSRKYWF